MRNGLRFENLGPYKLNRDIVFDNIEDGEEVFQFSINLALIRLNPFEHSIDDFLLASVVDQARKIVDDFSVEKLQGLVLLAEWVAQLDLSTSGWEHVLEREASAPNFMLFPGIVANRLSAVNLEGHEDFNDTEHAQILAALSLAFVSQALAARENGEESMHAILSASSAIGIAAQMQKEKEERLAQKRRSGSKGGKQRHKNIYAKYRRSALAIGRSGKFRSFKAAAHEFFKRNEAKLADDPKLKKKRLSFSTVCGWLRKDPKSRLAIKGR